MERPEAFEEALSFLTISSRLRIRGNAARWFIPWSLEKPNKSLIIAASGRKGWPSHPKAIECAAITYHSWSLGACLMLTGKKPWARYSHN
jgi:hypothetical protein